MKNFKFIFFKSCPNYNPVKEMLIDLKVAFDEVDLEELADDDPFRNYCSPTLLYEGKIIFGSETDSNSFGCSIFKLEEAKKLVMNLMDQKKKNNKLLGASIGGSVGLASLIGACGGVCTTAGFSLVGFLGSIGLGAFSVYLPSLRVPLLILSALLGLYVLKRLLSVGDMKKLIICSIAIGGGLIWGGINAFEKPTCTKCTSCDGKVDMSTFNKKITPNSKKVIQYVYRMWPELGRAPLRKEIIQKMGITGQELDNTFNEIQDFRKSVGLQNPLTKEGELIWLWPLSNLNTGIIVELENMKPIYARCAIDALGISMMYKKPITLKIKSPKYGNMIKLKINKNKIEVGESLLISYGGGGCDQTLFFSSQKEFDDYKEDKNLPNMKYFTMSQALSRGILIFGKLLEG